MTKSRHVTPVLLVIAVAVFAFPMVLNLIKGPVAIPGIFDQAYSLQEANQLSYDTGKPIFVLATADWCPPCQKLKRSALVDPQVVAWVREHTIPVYLEDGSDKQEISSLGVGSYPTTILIQDGVPLTSFSGALGAEQYLAQLSAALP